MRTIRLFAVLSIDGFLIPWGTQQAFDPEFSDYQKYYQNAAIVLAGSKGYRKLTQEVGIEKEKIAITHISASDKSISGDTTEKILSSIRRQKNRGTGYIAISEDNRSIITLLLEEKLVDELNIFIYPLLLGKGERVFVNLSNEVLWKVKKRLFFDNGITAICYIYSE